LDLIGFRRAVREGKCPIYVRGYSHVFVSGPSDGSECSDFVEIAEWDGSYHEGQRRFGGNRCRNFPEDHRHSVAGSSGRISTRFRKWSGLRQSPQVTYDRSCGSPIRKAGVNLVHHDLGDNFPMALRRDAEQILTVFRNPAKLGVFSIKDGALVSSLDGVPSSLSRIHSDLDVILKHANASPGRSRQGRTSHFARAETDCVAGVIGLELRNPSAIHVFEMS
jgi:hypothetical protein